MRPLLSLLLCASIILAQQNGNPRPAAFPASVATDTTLGVACNSARSTLDGAINDSALSFTVASGVTFCAPAYYTLGSGTAAEVIKICSASGATVTVCAGGRGIHGPPRAHPNATPVQILNDENYHNQLAAEVKAIQNGLGGGFLNTALLTRTMLFATDGAYDIGTTSGNRPGNLYASNGVWAFNVIGWPTKSLLVSPVNGNVLLTNATFSNFGLLQLGGTGATFPALKRNAAGISIRLADDSADAAITASQFNGSGAGLTTSTVPITALAAGNYSSKITSGTYTITADNATNATAVPWTGVSGKPTTFTPAAHTHPVADLSTVGDYSSKITSGTYTITAANASAVPWTGVSGKPTTFAPSAHASTHAQGAGDALTGTYTIHITGNSATVASLSVSSGAAPGANQVLRSDGNGYTNLGYINTNVGVDNPTIVHFYVSGDNYIRKGSLDNVARQVVNVRRWSQSFALNDPYIALPTGTVYWGVFQPQDVQSTIDMVQCWSDTSDATINLRRSDGVDFINGNLACNGTQTTNINNGYHVIPVGYYVGAYVISGSAKSIRIGFRYYTSW